MIKRKHTHTTIAHREQNSKHPTHTRKMAEKTNAMLLKVVNLLKNDTTHVKVFKELGKMGIKDTVKKMELLRDAINAMKPKKWYDSDYDSDDSDTYESDAGLPMRLTFDEKNALLESGKYGTKTSPDDWKKKVDNILKVRDGEYPSDWHEQVILGVIYFK